MATTVPTNTVLTVSVDGYGLREHPARVYPMVLSVADIVLPGISRDVLVEAGLSLDALDIAEEMAREASRCR